ncbi:hemerythrin domain-containing protein [Polaribacter sp.]|uniref:hemerythrin domain-containing protein n=1 Tax=Polaribacter sp. TaxID=1920175 RepID=UPI0040483F40
MNNLNSKTVIDFMVENIEAAEVFQKYGINYSNNSNCNIPLKNLCQRHHLQYDEIIKELNSLKGKVPYLKNYNVWDLDLLINFLVEIDHPFKKDNILFVEKLANKILEIHGKQLFEVEELVLLIHKISAEIQHHISIEEKTLFPYILFLNSPEKCPDKLVDKKPFLNEILNTLEEQHKNFNSIWNQIKQHTNHYQLYADVDNNFKLLLYKLKQFEEKLYNHLHIENNILFPKALELEKNYLQS